MADTELERVSKILSLIVSKKLINDETPSVEAFDLDYFKSRLSELKAAFPEDFIIHAVALKANSLRGILQEARERGFGAECASLGEAIHALSLDFSPSKVIYDSPVKTRPELERALKAGIVMNLDNDREILMVDELLKGSCAGSTSRIGLRINPVVGAGSIAIMSTCTKSSKFGLPVVEETRGKIIELYRKYSWLSGIHYHVGSQGVALPLFVAAAEFCFHLVQEIETTCGRNLKYIDIGGGVSTSYTSPSEPEEFSYARYRAELNEAVPEMFSGKYQLITEFGRSLFLKSGMTFARIDYVKNWIPDINPTLITHVGSNQFIRECYIPQQWRHRHLIASSDGVIKIDENSRNYSIGGPLCFQGDFIARDVALPEVEAGDILIILDTGAYTYSSYSRYNSILPSPVYAFKTLSEDGTVQVLCIKERETYEENLKFWGLEVPRIV